MSDGKEYVFFYRSGKGGWFKHLEQTIYINDAKGYQYIDPVDLEDNDSIRMPAYIRGTPTLVRLEPHGPKGPSRWEGKLCLTKLKDISGVEKIDHTSKPKGTGLSAAKKKQVSDTPPQKVVVPDDHYDETYGGPAEDEWGHADPISLDEADYAAENELYAS
jgi:hypothetical protein